MDKMQESGITKTVFMLICATVLTLPLRAQPVAVEVPIEAPGPQGPLRGTMLRTPGNQKQVALIIPGSGPTDRDGNNPLGMQAASYRLLAEGLFGQAITTVRIDKRGMFGSASALSDANAVTINDYVTDTAAWVSIIRAKTGAPCVWLIGHSEGGLVALAAAQKVKDLCGVVLVAAAGRPLGDVIKAQLRSNIANAPLIGAADAAIDRLASGQKVDVSDLPPPLLPLFHSAVQDYLINVFALDPARLAAGVELPILIVQGGKDLQVLVEDAERLKAANPSATLKVLPNVNHVLKDVASNSPVDNLATYTNADLPLGDGIASTIASFIND